AMDPLRLRYENAIHLQIAAAIAASLNSGKRTCSIAGRGFAATNIIDGSWRQDLQEGGIHSEG
ncbi:hypothetical protein A2U01_0112426, partial [Trifolium medium]|nr:hypothetical protein [Trifolium medium]